MSEERITAIPSWNDPRGEVMKTPDDVAAMVRLKACGWGIKRIARELGCSHHTVKHYVAAGGPVPFKAPQRPKALDGQGDWLRERFLRHRANADVVRQDLAAEKGILVSLRTLQRAVQPYRQALKAEALATVRFETPPGHQLQIDFGERLVEIGGAKVRIADFPLSDGTTALSLTLMLAPRMVKEKEQTINNLPDKTAKIRMLNDRFRKSLSGGAVLMSRWSGSSISISKSRSFRMQEPPLKKPRRVKRPSTRSGRHDRASARSARRSSTSSAFSNASSAIARCGSDRARSAAWFGRRYPPARRPSCAALDHKSRPIAVNTLTRLR